MKDSFDSKVNFFFFQGINRVSEEVTAQKRILKGLKRENFEVENFKALQYNITCSLDVNSSNRMFSSIQDFLSKTLSLNL